MSTAPQKITAWSFSRWNKYETCPRAAKYTMIDKLKEPGSAAMDRGSLIHGMAEHYLLNGGRLPKELTKLRGYYKELKAAKPKIELELCFDKNWNMTDWFGRDAWCRVKVDAMVTPIAEATHVRVIDHKTGKLKEYAEYENQLELYGMAGLLTVPIATESLAELAFIDHGKIVPCLDSVKAVDLPKLKKKWEAKVKPMLNDTVFAPRPSNACRWCHFRKANGGPCDY